MQRFLSRCAATSVITLAAAAALVMGGAGLAEAAPATTPAALTPHAAATPPYEPDPNAVGTLSFYDANGNAVTSGSTTDSPFASYAVGSASPEAGDVTAALFFCLPVKGQTTQQFTCHQVTGYNDYPVTDSGTPSDVANATGPVGTITSDDTTLAGEIATLPNTDTSDDGYAGLYQLRLRTSASELGNQPSVKYDDADILVSGNSYSIVYPKVVTQTSTSLTVTPTETANAPTAGGATETLTAMVTPDAPGTVTFYDGTTAIGSAVTETGTSYTTTTTLAPGTHSLTAQFTPTDSTTYGSSTSAVSSYTVAPFGTSTAVSFNPATGDNVGGAVTISATVTLAGASSAGGADTAGNVQFTGTNADGTVDLGTAAVNPSTGVASLPATTSLPAGDTAVTATFTPTDTTQATGSTGNATYTVGAGTATPATTSTTLSANPANGAPAGTPVTFTATVTSTATPAGNVEFYDGTIELGVEPVTASTGSSPTYTATYPTSTLSTGTHTINATFIPTDASVESSSKATALPYDIGPQMPTVTLTVTPTQTAGTPVEYAGTQETLTATLSPTSAGGTVAFYEGTSATSITTQVGTTQTVSGTGTASVSTTLPAGSYYLQADYTPSTAEATSYAAAKSAAVQYTVTAQTTTTTTLGVTPASPATPNTQETLTATVTPDVAGTVTFYDGTTAIGTPVSEVSGKYTTTTTLAAGSHSLKATFTPTSNQYSGSSSAVTSYTVASPDTEIIAVAGTNHSMYVSQGLKPFVSYGGYLTSTPQVVSTSTHDYYVVRGSANDLYVRTNSTAWTHLRPSAALNCASQPAAELSDDGKALIVDCTGTNGFLYGIRAPLPTTGNPVATTVTSSGVGHLPTSGTAAIGVLGEGAFGVVGGSSYAAQSGVHIAGNVYLVEGDPTAANFGQHVAIGGSCSGAPTLTETDANDWIVCHAATGADTLVYKLANAGGTALLDLHGSAIASPSALAGTDGIVVYVTGTNSRPYYAAVSDSGSVSGFVSGPVSGSAASGPFVAVGPSSAVSGSTRHFTDRL